MRDSWRIAAFSAAAFAAGAAAGAYLMNIWCSKHQHKGVHLNAAALQMLHSPAGEVSPSQSIAPSVYSLPGTPRVSANGRNFARSDSVGSSGGGGESRCVRRLVPIFLRGNSCCGTR